MFSRLSLRLVSSREPYFSANAGSGKIMLCNEILILPRRRRTGFTYTMRSAKSERNVARQSEASTDLFWSTAHD